SSAVAGTSSGLILLISAELKSMLPGAYLLRIRRLPTANSLTSRNMSLAPPARTLMPYHYSVASSPSQGTARPAFPFWQPVRHQPGLVPASSTVPSLPWPPGAWQSDSAFSGSISRSFESDPRRERLRYAEDRRPRHA